MDDPGKLSRLRAAVGLMRASTTDPELFAAVEALAEADGGFITAVCTRALAKAPNPAAIEDDVMAVMERFIADRQARIRGDGVPEPEVAAYTAMIGIAVAERLEAVREDMRAAETAGRH